MLIGTDTELFLRKDGKFISAHGLIPGSKANPYPVKKGMVQVDGMALEFGIDPAATWPKFRNNINTVLSRLQDMIPDNTEMALTASAHFDDKIMKEQPQEAIELGCDPDYNAWTGEENPAPLPHPTMRTAGGHIHIGFVEGKLKEAGDQAHFEDCRAVAKELDYYNGLYAVCQDEDVLRISMYGKAGAFRPKPYGVEYRVLSNFWLLRSDYMKRIFDGCLWAMNGLKNKQTAVDSQGDEAQYIINSNNVEGAAFILQRLGARK